MLICESSFFFLIVDNDIFTMIYSSILNSSILSHIIQLLSPLFEMKIAYCFIVDTSIIEMLVAACKSFQVIKGICFLDLIMPHAIHI